MYIRIILLWIGLFFTIQLSAQQTSPAARELVGEWVITKVATKLYAQDGGRLLDSRTIVSKDSIAMVRGFVPLSISFRMEDCTIIHSYGVEAGKYTVRGNDQLIYFRSQGLKPDNKPVTEGPSWEYHILNGIVLTINMPPGNYVDKQSKLPVKLVYTCYYEKKK
ncbi:hypothetical protein PV783_15315 [Chitinophaga sp. CC14]|uniref:hypothetical protein n=1 Tax=Chitinophaga sp. CC14 TaxID=3029199 RepID=UPI003B81A651